MNTKRKALRDLTAACGVVLGLAVSTAGHAEMGRTAGSWGVSPSGAATYSIPIWVQPGPRGIQPALAFFYDSRAGNGTMGVGWGLSGFDSIERCNSNAAEDGVDRVVNMSSQDRFCLAGNKLRITSGPLSSYGTTGSVYQTQLADFSRITSVGTAGSGPQSWIVHSKSGLIYEYGNTSDSRIVPAGSSNVLRWMLNKVSDRDGNSYAISYTTDNSVGRVPASVLWGPTTAGGSSYQYKATFNYVLKAIEGDIINARVMAVPLPTKQRLESVEIGYSANGTSHATKRQYRLSYEESPTTRQSRLREIKECAETISACLEPTVITYQDGAAGVSSTPSTALASVSSALPGKYDFNGDGRSDIAYFDGTVWRVAFSNGAGFGTGVNTGITGFASPAAGRFLSTHQDGFLANSGGTWIYVGFNGSSFSSANTDTQVNTGTSGAVVSDHDGDGLADLIWSELNGSTGVVRVRLNTSSGNATVPAFSTSNFVAYATSTGPAGNPGNINVLNVSRCPLERQCDVNGDGRADLAVNVTVVGGCGGVSGCSVTHSMYELISSGAGYSGTLTSPGAFSPGYVGIRFNDDRCVDTYIPGSTTLRVADCTPGGNATNITMPAVPVAVIDWDGDGNSDLLVNNGGTFGVYRSRGSTASPFDGLTTTSVPYNSSCNYFAADIDGDTLDDLVCASSAVIYFVHNGGGSAGTTGAGVYATQIPDLVSAITDGYDIAVSPSYVSTAQRNYTKGAGTTLPLVDATDPMIVAGRLAASDGIGGTFNLDYTYTGARRHGKLGMSSVSATSASGNVNSNLIHGPDGQSAGFEEIRVVDSRNGQQQRTRFEQLFPLTGMTKNSERYQSDHSTPISKTSVINLSHDLDGTTNNRRIFPYVSEVTTEIYEVGALNNQQITETRRTFAYADYTYGNVETVTTEVTDLHSTPAPSFDNQTWETQVTHTYDQPLTSGDSWCVGFVNRAVVEQSSTAPGVAAVTRTADFDADSSFPSKCRVKHKTVEPDNDQYRVVETYDFDSFGNVDLISVVGRTPIPGGYGNMPARETNIGWVPTGQFPQTIEDATGAVTTLGYYLDVGTLESVEDPNSTPANIIKTVYTYDAFGRKTRETRPDGTYTTWTYDDCATAGCANGLHRLTVKQTEFDRVNVPITDQFAYLDAFDRVFATRKPLLSGGFQWSEVQFDALGRLYKQYMPCATTSITSSCAGNAVTNSYDAVDRLTQSSRPQSAEELSPQATTYGYAGRIQTTTDALLRTTTRVMNVDSTVRRIIDANNYAISYAYDAAGSLKGITDNQPATRLSGVTVHYGIQPFMVEATDAALGHYTRTFNSLGELIGWTDAKEQIFSAQYDEISRMVFRDEPDTDTTFTYGDDPGQRNVGKLAEVSTTSSSGTYAEEYTYDTRGRLAEKSISIPTEGNFVYNYAYEPDKGWLDTMTYPVSTPGYRLALRYGYQNGIRNSVTGVNDSTVYWTATSMNAWGQTTDETLGNGVTTTRAFDAVNARLMSIHSGPNGNSTAYQNLSYLYDLVGNVIQRSAPGLTEDFHYSENGDQLYRLGSSTLYNGTTHTNLELEYDSSGNITRKETAEISDRLISQSISWTSYNYPLQITSEGETASFAYGPDRQRWKMEFPGGPANETTYYIGGLMEKVVGSTTIFRHTILGGDTPVAIYARSSSGTEVLRYVLGDHQGSTETFVEGTTVTKASFTAFGERRNAATWSGEPTNRTALDAITRQGYTYQTVLGSMGLNHMNGRVQDAVTGKFLSADPFITDPNYTQNYNRYSYVYNNPVTFTDPSGFASREVRQQCKDGCRARPSFTTVGGNAGSSGGRGAGGLPADSNAGNGPALGNGGGDSLGGGGDAGGEGSGTEGESNPKPQTECPNTVDPDGRNTSRERPENADSVDAVTLNTRGGNWSGQGGSSINGLFVDLAPGQNSLRFEVKNSNESLGGVMRYETTHSPVRLDLEIQITPAGGQMVTTGPFQFDMQLAPGESALRRVPGIYEGPGRAMMSASNKGSWIATIIFRSTALDCAPSR